MLSGTTLPTAMFHLIFDPIREFKFLGGTTSLFPHPRRLRGQFLFGSYLLWPWGAGEVEESEEDRTITREFYHNEEILLQVNVVPLTVDWESGMNRFLNGYQYII